MSDTKVDPWALLREARDFMRQAAVARGPCPDCTECDHRDAIIAKADTALAAHEAEERVESPKVEWTWSHGGWCEGVSIRIDEVFDAKCWSWEVTGTASTQDEARAAASQAAAIAAARGMR